MQEGKLQSKNGLLAQPCFSNNSREMVFDLKKRTIVRHLDPRANHSTRSNDKILLCRLDHISRHKLHLISDKNMFDLEHQSLFGNTRGVPCVAK